MGAACCSKSVKTNTTLHTFLKNNQSNSEATNTQIKLVQPETLSIWEYNTIPMQFNQDLEETQKLKLPGLENLSNNCYMNAVLQALLVTQPLVYYFLKGKFHDNLETDDDYTITEAFSELVEYYWSASYDFIRPGYLMQLIWDSQKQFQQGMQADSHEFLEFFLQTLSSQTNRSKQFKVQQQSKIIDNDKGAAQWAQELQQESSIIIDIFKGQLKTIITCMKCKQERINYNSFQSLSIPIQESETEIDIIDCIREYLKEDRIDLEEKWVCKNCQKEEKAKKRTEFFKLPPVLIIQLKRFKYGKKSEKLLTQVQYPLENLDLTQFVTGLYDNSPVYSLYARIDHTGELNHGHYKAICQNFENSQWLTFDDHISTVTPIDKTMFKSRKSYMLFYYNQCYNQINRQGPQFHKKMKTYQNNESDGELESQQSPANYFGRLDVKSKSSGISTGVKKT